MLQASDAARVAGLSMHQLREWSSRRGLLSPDIPGAGRGRHALFSWQTVLTLRLLVELQHRFGAEVGAWSAAVEEVRQLLKERTFPSLWGSSVIFADCRHARLVDDSTVITEGLQLALSPHLQALTQSFELPAEPHQRSLFPAVGLRR